MTRRPDPRLIGLALLGILAVVIAVQYVPVPVRHNAPLGVSRTIDSGRGIAVRGGYVTPNYDGFDRIDLDLRAYSSDPFYDFTVHIRPEGPDQADVRTVALRLAQAEVWHAKGAFENSYVTVRFPEIADTAGQRYYVWVEGGPRQRDDIWTLWRIKSYSTVSTWDVAKAWVDAPPEPLGRWVGGIALVAVMGGTVVSLLWLVAALPREQVHPRPTKTA